MVLKHLSLQNFRSYSKSDFTFDKDLTFIVGPNTAGKTNLIEAITFLALGKSFRAEKDIQAVRFGDQLARIKGVVDFRGNETELEVVVSNETTKRYMVNGVSRRRLDFVGNLVVVLFSPLDLGLIAGSPFLRRNFLNSVLEQSDRDYRLSLIAYEKGIRQRNALLEGMKEKGWENPRQLEYWDQLLIKNGEVITKKREELIGFFNQAAKEIFDFAVIYDRSVISKERLEQYREAERGAGVTLVGPHRDDVSFSMFNNSRQTTHDVKLFGSRGQQRLVVLQLKLLQLLFVEKAVEERPILLLDDIFSELDEGHIGLILDYMEGQQTIITTTHQEFISKELVKKAGMIELKN